MGMWQRTLAEVVSNKKIMEQHYLMEIYAPQIAQAAKPGQFLHLQVAKLSSDPLLRRPISIFNVNLAKGTISLAYRVVGRGTTMMTCWQQGDKIDAMGPLGNGFKLPEKNSSSVLVVGGGIGLAPLNYLVWQLVEQGHGITLLAGMRNISQQAILEYFPQENIKIAVATDDGSYGKKGFVVELSEEYIAKGNFDLVYSCGPEPMMEIVAKQAKLAEVGCQISLERTMACGVGACLGCTCSTNKTGKLSYSHVCIDGPVFWGSEVLFND